jgi:hypothetical protein
MAVFKDLMNGLDEVDAFQAGETAGYKVTLPAEVESQTFSERDREVLFDVLANAPKPNARLRRAFRSARERIASR